jgi:hypothetical protein
MDSGWTVFNTSGFTKPDAYDEVIALVITKQFVGVYDKAKKT